MAKAKRAPSFKPPTEVDWTGVRTQRVEYESGAIIFGQGDPAGSVLYIEEGAVRLSVLSRTGKEAVIALLEPGHFFGEGCLAGQAQRIAQAKAMTHARSWSSRRRRSCGSSTIRPRSRTGSCLTC